jgi:hypothetical protein
MAGELQRSDCFLVEAISCTTRLFVLALHTQRELTRRLVQPMFL